MWRGAVSIGSSEAVERARGSSNAAEDDWMTFPEGGDGGMELVFSCCTYRTMFAILPGLEDLVMTVVTPADVARRAATILVDIPPVPNAEPGLDTEGSISVFVEFRVGEWGRSTVCCERRDIFYDLDGLGVRVCPGVLVIQAVDICHEEEIIGVNHRGGDGGEGIIVSELDFGHGDGVVLVDDGNDAHFEELGERVLSIEVLGSLDKNQC